jgi:hypothetical protein
VHKRTRAVPFCRFRVRLCTRVGAPCAQADKNGAIRPILCPTLHTPKGSVCTNGQERCHSAGFVSDFAHAWAPRVHKRTRPVPIRRANGRLRTRPYRSRAYADVLAVAPCRYQWRRGLSETGQRHARMMERSKDNRALRTLSQTPSPWEVRTCSPVIYRTIRLLAWA